MYIFFLSLKYTHTIPNRENGVRMTRIKFNRKQWQISCDFFNFTTPKQKNKLLFIYSFRSNWLYTLSPKRHCSHFIFGIWKPFGMPKIFNLFVHTHKNTTVHSTHAIDSNTWVKLNVGKQSALRTNKMRSKEFPSWKRATFDRQQFRVISPRRLIPYIIFLYHLSHNFWQWCWASSYWTATSARHTSHTGDWV